MRLAHFSDFHLGFENLRREGVQLRRLIDRAIGQGAEHLLFGGDIVDAANLDDAEILRRHLRRRGFLRSDRFSIVPGNHDIWPVGEGRLFQDLPRAVLGDIRALARLGTMPAQRNIERFTSMFQEAFEDCECYFDRSPFPGVKIVGPLALGFLDTTSCRGGRYCASGRFDKDEGRWIRERLRVHRGPKALLMHHWPFPWRPDLEGAMAKVRDGLARMGLEIPVSFEPVRPIQDFIRRSGSDIVFCGHLHWCADEWLNRTLGPVRIALMGRSGGVHQDREERILSYHLIDVKAGTIRIRTEEVPAAACARP